jgi:GMC oxidoreductase
MNGPMRTGAGYINMNIAADGSRVKSSRAFLRPNLDRPNLTLLLNTNVSKVVFDGDRARGVELVTGDGARKCQGNPRSDPGGWRGPSREASHALGRRRRHVTATAWHHAGRQFAERRPEPAGSCPRVRRRLPIQGEDRTARPTATRSRPKFTCRNTGGGRLLRRAPKEASRSRPRLFSRPAVGMCGLPARIGAMRRSSKATIWTPTATRRWCAGDRSGPRAREQGRLRQHP